MGSLFDKPKAELSGSLLSASVSLGARSAIVDVPTLRARPDRSDALNKRSRRLDSGHPAFETPIASFAVVPGDADAPTV